MLSKQKSLLVAMSTIISLHTMPLAMGDTTTPPPAAAEAIALQGATLDLGTLKTSDLSPLNRTFSLKRTKATAQKVAVTFTLKTVSKACVDADVEVTQVPEHKFLSCTPNLNRGNDCEEVVFEAYQTARRICKKEGLVLTEVKKGLTLDFKKAVVLTEKADELFELNIAQVSMNAGDFKLKAQATDTDSMYDIKVRSEKVSFKAQ